MAARPGPEIHCGGNQQGDQGQPILPSYSQGHSPREGRTKARESTEELLCLFAVRGTRLGDDR